MNKNIIKGLLIFTAGAGVGAFFMRRRLINKYEQLVQEEIASVREHLGGPIYDSEEEEEYMPPKPEPKEDTIKRFGSVTGRTEYDKMQALKRKFGGDVQSDNAMSDPEDISKPEDPDGDYNECESKSKAANNGVSRNPYVISMYQYDNEKSDYDKICISYYNDDATLADENDQIVDDIFLLIGKCLEHFGEKSEDPDVVYVRNDNLGIDYEVVAKHTSYKSAVLGEED